MAEYVYPEAERPEVEVEVDGLWHPGVLCGWRDVEGQRQMDVEWRTELGSDFIDTVPNVRVRGTALKPAPPAQDDGP